MVALSVIYKPELLVVPKLMLPEPSGALLATEILPVPISIPPVKSFAVLAKTKVPPAETLSIPEPLILPSKVMVFVA